MEGAALVFSTLSSGVILSTQTALIPEEDCLYFLDVSRKAVGVAKLDGTQRKRLIVHDDVSLRGIAVDPVAR